VSDKQNMLKNVSGASGIDRLIRLVTILKGENGCPWDKKQTPESISVYLAEEVHELVHAIQTANSDEVCEELGDVIFIIIFIAEMYKKEGLFDLDTAINLVCGKMIRRHPHVFEDSRAKSVGDIRKQWREIKKNEKGSLKNPSLLDSVPSGLPALMRAYRVSERAAGVGFDWDHISDVLKKVEEEIAEFKEAVSEHDKNKTKTEFGDILFTLVNVARFAKIHPETALYDAIGKFQKRFNYMEEKLSEDGMDMECATRDMLDRLWEEAKNNS
jgi:nucleoside triphosphate diphosphatase